MSGVLPVTAGTAVWLKTARRARTLSWVTLGWLGIEAAAAVGAALAARSVALLGFGLDSGVEALASVIVIWRLSGSRLTGALSERRAQQLVALSFLLLSPYIAVESLQAIGGGHRPETSVLGIILTAGTAVLEPPLGIAKRRLGARLGSRATVGEGTQNLLCSTLAVVVLISLLADTVFGLWWLDGAAGFFIGAWALVEARRAWRGESCACAASC